MKIGVLLSRFPYPLEKGDKLRAYYQLKELAKNNEIYLCALCTKKISQKDIAAIEPYCKDLKIVRLSKIEIALNMIYSLIFSKLPMQVAYFFNRKFKASIQHFFQSNKVDHIYCQLIRTSEYLKDYKYCSKTIDYMDALSQGMERRIAKAPFYLKPFVKMEAMRLKRYEHFIFEAFNQKVIISEQDRESIVHAKNHEIHIIRNGVDQEYYKPQEKEKVYDLLFTGNMSYPPNIDGVEFLVNKVMPLIWEIKPNVKLVIAGANPSQRVLKLEQDKVIITGWVDDIRDYYAKSHIFIAPMQIGSGLQNKLLEAMAMQIPCITSPLANNALKAIDRESILIGNDPESYKNHIIELLDNPRFARQIAKNGRAFVSKNFDWTTSTNELQKLFIKNE